MSVYQSTGECLYFSVQNLISQCHILICVLYINAYHRNKEITNTNKEIYNVLKFTVLCHVIFLLFAVLQWL